MLTALAARYKGDAYAFFTHVRNCTGYARHIRECDALAMSLWPSRGLELIGFEVKVTRSDWRRELNDPDKAERSLYRYCDRWFVVAPPDVVNVNDVPPTWGLLVYGTRWVTARQAPKLEPTAIDRKFLASLLRRLHEEEMQPMKLKAEFERGMAEGAKGAKHAAERAAERITELQHNIQTFEEASGIRIGSWDAGRIGEAVNTVLTRRDRAIRGQIERLREQLGRLVEQADKALAETVESAEP